MTTTITAFILPAIALLLSIGGLIGLRVMRRRFHRRSLATPVCPRCRYPADATRACSECGADLPAIGVVDADWPRRREWLIRAGLVILVTAPIPIAVGSPVRNALPARQRQIVATVIGVIDAQGEPRETLLVREERRWFSPGVNLDPPAATVSPVDVSFGLPPADRSRRLSSVEATTGPVAPERIRLRASLADDAYDRRTREELDGVAEDGLEMADAIVAGGGAAAASIASTVTTEAAGGIGISTKHDMHWVTRNAGQLERSVWSYQRLPAGSRVPMVRHAWRSSTSVIPAVPVIGLGSVLLAVGLLGRGLWLARSFRAVVGPPT